MKKILTIIIIFFLALAVICCYASRCKLPAWFPFPQRAAIDKWQGVSFIKWFPFNKENALNEWQEKIFRGRVLYVVKIDNRGKGYLEAKSDNAASGIFYKVSYDARKFPFMSWKWQVERFPQKTDGNAGRGWIERDDYAARVYVIFPSFYFMNTKCLEYVWDENLPKGKIVTSQYFRNIKLIAVESGDSNLGKWVFVERNIPQDFEAAFGRPLREKVGAIAIMTDADNTASGAEANYGEIRVGYGKNEKN